MFRFITINHCKRKIKLNDKQASIIQNNKYMSKIDLYNKENREIIFAGNKKLIYIYIFDTNTKHEIYKNNKENRFEIIIFKSGKTKPIAYINLDDMLLDILGTKDINFESVKLKKLISEWLYKFANIYYYDNYLLKTKSFDEVSMDFYLKIFKELSRRVDKEFTN